MNTTQAPGRAFGALLTALTTAVLAAGAGAPGTAQTTSTETVAGHGAASVSHAASPTGSAVQLTQAATTTLDNYLLSVAQSSAGMWQRSLTAAGYTWRTVYVNISDGIGRTGSDCGTSGDPTLWGTSVNPAFYCPNDNTIYLSSEWISAYVESGLNHGTDGAAFVVSHEMGHAVQHMENNDEQPGVVARPWELQADCLSGVWFNQAGFAQADASAADQTAYDLGDNQTTSLQHHGTPAERAAAFWTGYQTGQGTSCPLDVGAGS